MVGWRVDVSLKEVAGDHVAVVDEDSPELDKDEEANVEVFVQGEQVHKDANESARERDETLVSLLVWQGLCVSIQWVERESRPGSGH